MSLGANKLERVEIRVVLGAHIVRTVA
jgi:hypothetical protein